MYRVLLLALAIFTPTLALADAPPIPPGSIDHVGNQSECADTNDGGRDCVTVITFEVSELFVRRPLSRQTDIMNKLITWWMGHLPVGDQWRFEATLNHELIGFSNENDWIWDARYVAQINRRALH